MTKNDKNTLAKYVALHGQYDNTVAQFSAQWKLSSAINIDGSNIDSHFRAEMTGVSRIYLRI